MARDFSLKASKAHDAPLLILVLAGLFLFGWMGLDLTSSSATIAACVAIMVFGLPHGTLDVEILKNQHRCGLDRVAAVLMLYVGIAAITYLLWQIAPLAALAMFLVTAAIHFSEDYQDVGSAFLAQGMAVALLTAPAFLHLPEMQGLFVAVSGQASAAVIGEIMLLLAPVGLAVAAIALLHYWQCGRRDRAVGGIAVLAGMALLPPAIGFAAFFCLYHSPSHFRAALTKLSAAQFRHRWHFVVPLTLTALSFAGWLFIKETRGELVAQLVAASFMTLSILTVPHMIVPAIVARLFGRPAFLTSPLKEYSNADQGSSRIPAQG